MLYRATECSKRAASPPRNNSPCGNNGGQLAMTGAPVSDETMPDSTGAMIAPRSTQTIASETHVSALSQNLPTHPHLSGGKKSDGQSMDEYGLDMARQA